VAFNVDSSVSSGKLSRRVLAPDVRPSGVAATVIERMDAFRWPAMVFISTQPARPRLDRRQAGRSLDLPAVDPDQTPAALLV
jgi:hypothetical protein